MADAKVDEQRKLILHVKPENYFRVANGTVIKDLLELDRSLDNMGEETFQYHVNDYKNDFSVWVRGAVGDEKLADDLLTTKDRNKTQVLVLRRLVEAFKPKE